MRSGPDDRAGVKLGGAQPRYELKLTVSATPSATTHHNKVGAGDTSTARARMRATGATCLWFMFMLVRRVAGIRGLWEHSRLNDLLAVHARERLDS